MSKRTKDEQLKKKTLTATYYTEEGFRFRYLPQPAAVPRSPNSGLAVMTVVTCKQMSEDNHGYVRMSMQGS